LSHEAIAEVMDLTPRTVTNHIMLALQTLRDRLEKFQAIGGAE
jgi:DNA-directed RNA polymerase specialized sigma24 family protein